MYALVRNNKIIGTYLTLSAELETLYPTVSAQEAAGYYLVQDIKPVLSEVQKITSRDITYNIILNKVIREYTVVEDPELRTKYYMRRYRIAGTQRELRKFNKLSQNDKIQVLLERGI